jgi:hypothetical protein
MLGLSSRYRYAWFIVILHIVSGKVGKGCTPFA